MKGNNGIDRVEQEIHDFKISLAEIIENKMKETGLPVKELAKFCDNRRARTADLFYRADPSKCPIEFLFSIINNLGIYHEVAPMHIFRGNRPIFQEDFDSKKIKKFLVEYAGSLVSSEYGDTADAISSKFNIRPDTLRDLIKGSEKMKISKALEILMKIDSTIKIQLLL